MNVIDIILLIILAGFFVVAIATMIYKITYRCPSCKKRGTRMGYREDTGAGTWKDGAIYDVVKCSNCGHEISRKFVTHSTRGGER